MHREITYDPEVDRLVIWWGERPAADAGMPTVDVVLSYNASDEVVGIEIENASKNLAAMIRALSSAA